PGPLDNGGYPAGLSRGAVTEPRGHFYRALTACYVALEFALRVWHTPRPLRRCAACGWFGPSLLGIVASRQARRKAIAPPAAAPAYGRCLSAKGTAKFAWAVPSAARSG